MRNKYFLLSFLTPLVVRAIPEIVSYPWPIGSDTVAGYALVIGASQIYGMAGVLSLFGKGSAALLFVLLGFFGTAFNVDAFLFLKLLTPVLCGFLGFALFYFSSNYLGWSDRKSLICAILCTLYFVTLRITWDLLRNTFGLAFLFLAIPQTKSLENWRSRLLFMLLSLLCLFTHELVAVLLFCVIAYLLLLELLRSYRVSDTLTGVKHYLSLKVKLFGRPSEQADFEHSRTGSGEHGKLEKLNHPTALGESARNQKLFGADFRPWVAITYIFVDVIIFIVVLYYVGFFRVNISSNPSIPNMKGPFVDYISLSSSTGLYTSVDVFRGDIFSLFLVCFAPILPLAVLGYFRNHSLDIMTLFLSVGSFMPAAFPHFALPLWNRWMLMLTFPFIIYACNFLLPGNQDSPLIRRLKISKKTRNAVFAFVVPMLVILSSIYMTVPVERAFPYFSLFGVQGSLPSSMQENSVGLYQCPYVVLTCEWLKWNMPLDSSLVVHDSLYSWANLTLPFRPIYRYSSLNVGLASALSKAEMYNSTYVLTIIPYDYFIWSNGFELIFRMGWIEVFRSAH